MRKVGERVKVTDGGYAYIKTEAGGIVIEAHDGTTHVPRGYDVAVLVNYATPELMNLFFLEEEVE